jgi:hypothetical protein
MATKVRESKADAMLAKIGKNLSAAAGTTTPGQQPQPVKSTAAAPDLERKDPDPATPSKSKSFRPGKTKLLYFGSEEYEIFRELTVWVASQGIRPSDSLIARAALVMIKPGQAFREALETVLSRDKRKTKPGKKTELSDHIYNLNNVYSE